MSSAASLQGNTALWAPRCPLCGQPNGCAVSATGRFDTPCWCADVSIDPGVLERAREGGRACVCRACAEGNRPDAARATTAAPAAPSVPAAPAAT